MIKKLCDNMPNLVFPADELAGLSYYEILCKIHAKLNAVIEQVNSNESNISSFTQDMTDKYNRLLKAWQDTQDWINHYFDNLDVQEEINNKLEEMLNSGEWANIIYNFFKINRVFLSVQEMKADENIMPDMLIGTTGYYTSNDGGGAQYIVRRQKTDGKWYENLSNNLYAELVIKDIPNILQFGARNNGITNISGDIFYYEGNSYILNQDIDNTNIFQEAFNIVGGGDILIPKGFYILKNTLIINNGINIIGSGRDSTVLLFNSKIDEGITFVEAASSALKNVTLANMLGENGVKTGISVKRANPSYGNSKIVIENVECDGFIDYGFRWYNGAWLGNYNYLFALLCAQGFFIGTSDTTFYNLYASKCNIVGINYQGSNNAVIGGKVFNCGSHTTAYQSVQISSFRNKLVGVDVQDNLGNGITLLGKEHIISGCHIDCCGKIYDNQPPINAYAINGNATHVNVQCEITNYLSATETQYGGINLGNAFSNSIFNVIFGEGITNPWNITGENFAQYIVSNIMPTNFNNYISLSITGNSVTINPYTLPIVNIDNALWTINNGVAKLKVNVILEFNLSILLTNTSSGNQRNSLEMMYNNAVYKDVQYSINSGEQIGVNLAARIVLKKDDEIYFRVRSSDSYPATYTFSNLKYRQLHTL